MEDANPRETIKNAKNNMQDKAEEQMGHLNSYASRHPRRMWTGAFLIGVGAGIVAARISQDDRSAFQKFLDNFGD